jgi:hypothetical protein
MMALNTIYNGIDSKVFEQIKDLERASEVCVRLEKTYESTSTVKVPSYICSRISYPTSR